MSASSRVRVLIADDHTMVRDGLKRLIDNQEDMAVVAEAADGPEAVRLSATTSPDVALLDISMPGWDGITTAQKLAAECPRVRIIAVTRYSDEGFVRKMLDAGASGYVLKQQTSSDLVDAIRRVAEGQQYIDPSIGRSRVAEPQSGRPAGSVDEAPLTAIEEDVLNLVAALWSNQRIAERLRLNLDELADLKARAMRKKGLLTRADVLAYARAKGWSDIP